MLDRHIKIITTVFLAASILICGAGSASASDAARRAAGDVPSAKTDITVKAERELDRLLAAEKALKEKISGATINRSKLLAQKRAELKEARQKRDGPISNEITKIKDKKAAQTELIRDIKNKLAAAKKNKNVVSTGTYEANLKKANDELVKINASLVAANERLKQSYNKYKTSYDSLTQIDSGIKEILELNKETEKKIKEQKADFSNTKKEYNQSIKNKDFLTAEHRMNSLVFIQTGINGNYTDVLNIKLKVKSDYYELIVNFNAV